MRKTLYIIALAALSLSLTSCLRKASDVYGEDKSIVAEAHPFRLLEVETACVVHFTQDSVTEVRLTGPEKLVDEVAMEYKDSTLRVFQDNKIKDDRYIRLGEAATKFLHIYISSPTLDGVTTVGSGYLEASSVTTDRLFNVIIAGSGSVGVKHLTAPKLTISVRGSGNLNVEKADIGALETVVAGSGNISIDATGTQTASLTVSGSGNTDATLHRAGDVSASVHGSGNISISGDAVSLTTDTEGSGNIDTDSLTITKKH